MQKRFLLAVSLSMAVLWFWSTFLIKPGVQPTPPPATNSSQETENISPKLEKLSPSLIIDEKSFTNSPWEDVVDIEFEASQAIVKSVVFGAYQEYKFNLINTFLLKDNQGGFKKAQNNLDVFVQSDENKEIIKRFNYSKTKYYIELAIEIKNLTNKTISFKDGMSLGRLNFTGNQVSARFQDVVISQEDKNLHFDGRKDKVIPGIKYIGLRDRYFAIIIQPKIGEGEIYNGYIKKISSSESEVVIDFPEMTIGPSQSVIKKFDVYLGPQEVGIIKAIKPEWAEIVYFGFFNSFAWVLLNSLTFINNIVHNWGLSIIILSIIINILLFPITMKQVHSMKKTQEVQPEMEKIKKAYKDNPQKMHQETMALYKKHHLNPLGGCLFGILQWPLFIAFLQGLSRFLSLKGAGFLWIKDLSEPDKAFQLPMTLPMIGKDLNLLPLLVAFGYFIQQKMSTVASDDKSVADQQKMMTLLMPIMFSIFFYSMPSGVVLYWFVNTALMILMLYSLKRKDEKEA